MGNETTTEPPRLELVHTVQCLECKAVYAKPSTGGTATANPGCPDCGYVGWVATSARLMGPLWQRRFGADHLPQSSG
jgi:hypothetical protein